MLTKYFEVCQILLIAPVSKAWTASNLISIELNINLHGGFQALSTPVLPPTTLNMTISVCQMSYIFTYFFNEFL